MCEGNHHGQLDTFLFSHYCSPAGPARAPETVNDSPLGLPKGSNRLVLTLLYGDTEAAIRFIKAHADRLAAVILEPLAIFGVAIPADVEFVRGLRAVTQESGTLLIVDEVPTGVRVGPGGVAGRSGVSETAIGSTCLGVRLPSR